MDYQLEQWINGPAGSSSGLDTFMRDAADWGQWIFAGIVVAWLIYGWVHGGRRDRWGAIAALIGAAIALGVNQVLGHLWVRPRPFIAHPGTVHTLISHANDGSFPSDHAAAGFAIATTLWLVHRRWGTVALLAAVVMSYARVFDGVHYPGDVLAGAAIGAAVAWGVMRWCGRPLDALESTVDRGAHRLHLPIPPTD
jgi:undecaprenyl-diphosphatase